MSTLFIIGNGFDLAHNLTTSYFHLKQFLKNTNLDIYKQINEQLFIGDKNLWSSFESNVGTDDTYFEYSFRDLIQEAIDTSESMPVGGDWRDGDVLSQKENNDYAIENEIEQVLHSGYEKFKFDILYETFLSKLEELLNIADAANFAEKPNKTVKNLIKSNNNSKFITFNYTHTLEHIFHVDSSDIMYIHGELGKSNLLFGNEEKSITKLPSDNFFEPDHEYKTFIKDAKSFDQLTSIEKENYLPPETQHDYSAHPDVMAVNASPYVEQYNERKNEWIKPLNTEAFEDYLTQYNFTKIFILGHSFGEVDKKYFDYLCDYFPDLKWNVSVHEPNKTESSTRTNIQRYFPKQEVNFFQLDDPIGEVIP